MTRKELLQHIRTMTGLSLPDIDLVWVATISGLNPSEWTREKMVAAILIHRYQVSRLHAEIKSLAAGNKRRNYPKSYAGESRDSADRG